MWSKMTKVTKILCILVLIILCASIVVPFLIGGTDGDKLQYVGSIFGITISVFFSLAVMYFEKDFSNKEKIIEEKNKYKRSLEEIGYFLEIISTEFQRRLGFSKVDGQLNTINQYGLLQASLIEKQLEYIGINCPDIDKNEDLFTFLYRYIVFRAQQIDQCLENGEKDAAKSAMAYMLHNSRLLIKGCDKGKISFEKGEFKTCSGDTSRDKKYSMMLIEEINKQSK